MPPRVAVASGMRSLPVSAFYGFAAHLRGAVLDSFDDVDVAGAAAQVARNAAANVGLRRIWIGREQRLGDHQHARRAEATLQSVLLPEALLQRVELRALGQALNSLYVRPVRLDSEERARFDGDTVQDDSAGAAIGGVAADVGAREVQVLPEKMNQQESRFNLRCVGLTIYRQADAGPIDWRGGHAVPPWARAAARRNARRVSSRTIACL